MLMFCSTGLACLGILLVDRVRDKGMTFRNAEAVHRVAQTAAYFEVILPLFQGTVIRDGKLNSDNEYLYVGVIGSAGCPLLHL